MAISENLRPAPDRVALELGVVFEQLPHPIVLLSPELCICEVNAAGRRFLGKPGAELIGARLFDILPPASPGGTDWQSRLRASYDEVRDLREPVTLLLSARHAALPDGVPESPANAPAVVPKPPDGSGMWHVCHGPIVDAAGNLIAIATHALALCGIEAAIAQVGSFATAQLFTVQRSAGSVVDAPIVRAGADAPMAVAGALGALSGEAAHLPAHSGRMMSILMVEDNQDLRSSTSELLQFLGHRVVSVPDAEQALRQLESGAFDILFTDLTLPKMSGAELARHVLQHYRQTRVIITSGYGRAMANAQNLDAVFLPKPYRVADLEEVLAKIPANRS